MAKKRLTRKQLLKEPDEFITLTGRVISWSRRNSRRLTYGTCAVLTVIFVVAVYYYYQQSRARSAAVLLGEGLARYQSAAKSPADNLAAASEDFKKLIDHYGDSPAGRFGRVVFAHYNLVAGLSGDALTLYQNAQRVFGSDPSLTNIVLNGLGCAHEQKGEIAAAIGAFEKIAQGRSAIFKDSALFHLGRLYEQTGKSDESVKAYGRLNSDFPNSIFAPLAREKAAG